MGRLREGVETAVLVGGGGVAGATVRYAVSLAVPGLAGTVAVNVLGSLGLGTLLYTTLALGHYPRRLRLALGTGVLSSFTTYSTFAVEATTAPPTVAAGYVVATYGLGIGGVLAGRGVAGRVVGGVR